MIITKIEMIRQSAAGMSFVVFPPLFPQAKEQGKAEVEELLSKLEKVRRLVSQVHLNVFNSSKSVELTFTVICFRPTLSNRRKYKSSRKNCPR